MVVAENYSSRAPSQGVYEWFPILEKMVRTVTYWKSITDSRLQRLYTELHIGIHRGGRRNTLAAFGLVLEGIERGAKYVTRLQGRSYKEIGGALC